MPATLLVLGGIPGQALSSLAAGTVAFENFKFWPTPGNRSWQNFLFWDPFRGPNAVTISLTDICPKLRQDVALSRATGAVLALACFGSYYWRHAPALLKQAIMPERQAAEEPVSERL